jgi:hypothetical protein
MRKVIAGLDREQREALIYVVDLGTAVSLAALIASVLKWVGDLL